MFTLYNVRYCFVTFPKLLTSLGKKDSLYKLTWILKCMSRNIMFPTMWYVWPAMPQISLRIRTVWSEPLLIAWLSMSAKPLSEHQLEFLSSKGGCTCLSESTIVKMPRCWLICLCFVQQTHADTTLQSYLAPSMPDLGYPYIWAVAYDFQQCGVLTREDSYEPV